jgi:hypothetical protein
MRLPSWLRPSRPEGRGVLIGDGQFGFAVVGTAFHQQQLEAIAAARAKYGFHRFCAALVAPQPDNPHNRRTAVVLIHGIEVGYLDRESARDFGSALTASGFADVACEAEIVGGWVRSDDDWGYVGLRLNAFLPFSIVAADKYLNLPANQDLPGFLFRRDRDVESRLRDVQ